ncbi:TPM domain-containing protein [Blattabacterium cuenoti]|uniref:TPM domain-containing protein n=1 Tax=Blattabacterium cuenoti TaxID=1653831 RepID=UPI001EECACAF|nr:TPM domain-containing protein [Blattabacterium cuenoti]
MIIKEFLPKMKNIIVTIQFLFLFSLIFFTNSVKGQFNIPNKPKKIYPVNDYVGILSETQINQLNKKLIQYHKKTSTEIIISIIQDLRGEDPNYLASKWGNKWGIGKTYKNNGIIVLLSINDKKISIQNGYGIEPYVTDFSTKRIIQKITPLLKNNLYYKAIDLSIKEVFKIMKNEYENKKVKNNFHKKNWIFYFSFILLLLFFFYQKQGIEPSLFNPLFLSNMFFWNKNFDNQEENDFDEFGEGGGNFGGGGSSGGW